jgi:hypothetical protein
MKKETVCLFFSLGLLLSWPETADAAPINLSFENGMDGWEISSILEPDFSDASVTPGLAFSAPGHASDLGNHYAPVDGAWLAVAPGGYETTASYTSSFPTIIRQDVYLRAGDSVSGWAAFDARDFYFAEGPNDFAFVHIGGDWVWRESVETLAASCPPGECSEDRAPDGPWTYWEWRAPADGDYTLSLGSVNSPDPLADSYALFDRIAVTAVPEPATILLLTIGLASMAKIGGKNAIFRKQVAQSARHWLS